MHDDGLPGDEVLRRKFGTTDISVATSLSEAVVRFIESVYDGLAWSARAAWRALSGTETGRVRWYAAGITIGALVITTIVIFL